MLHPILRNICNTCDVYATSRAQTRTCMHARMHVCVCAREVAYAPHMACYTLYQHILDVTPNPKCVVMFNCVALNSGSPCKLISLLGILFGRGLRNLLLQLM